MELHIAQRGKNKTAVVEGAEKAFTDVQSALDFMMQISYETGCDSAVVLKECVPEEFFDLKTRLAGEILQKFTNYRFRLAIVGDFDNIQSKSLRDFILESNLGKRYLFVSSEQEALDVFLV
ncbi:MAG: DUF4180 domain-containing protein [Eubacteriales bacterium]